MAVESEPRELIGKTGIAESVLRPSGKVLIEDEIYDAVSEYGFINKNEKVIVLRYMHGQLYFAKDDKEEHGD